MGTYRNVLFTAGLLALAACSDNNTSGTTPIPDPEPPVEPGPTYRAEIIRTDYGIPHITADDWGSLGYGYGYAFSQDNYCVLMREILYATGQSAEFLGDEGNLGSDFVYRWYNGDTEALENEWLGSQPENFQALARGYTAGVNRYLADTGKENLATGPEGCRDADWVREISVTDSISFWRKALVQGGIDNGIIRNGIADVEGPSSTSVSTSELKRAPNNFKGFLKFVGKSWKTVAYKTITDQTLFPGKKRNSSIFENVLFLNFQ